MFSIKARPRPRARPRARPRPRQGKVKGIAKGIAKGKDKGKDKGAMLMPTSAVRHVPVAVTQQCQIKSFYLDS